MTTDDMEHERLRDSSGLYVLDALNATERLEFERHLASCAECAEEVRSLRGVAGALSFSVPQVDPPAALRSRVLAAVGAKVATTNVVPMPRPSPPGGWIVRAGWLSAAALFILSTGLGFYSWSLEQRVTGLEDRLRDTQAQLVRTEQRVAISAQAASVAETRLAVLLALDMQQVNLEGQPVAPRASGRAFWSRSRGLVLTAANLPPLPQGRIYQLWMVTPAAPVSAGLLVPDPAGAVAQTFTTPVDVATPVAIALTIEPEGGLPAPSGDKYLVGLTH